jgi:hypothetical protein
VFDASRIRREVKDVPEFGKLWNERKSEGIKREREGGGGMHREAGGAF